MAGRNFLLSIKYISQIVNIQIFKDKFILYIKKYTWVIYSPY